MHKNKQIKLKSLFLAVTTSLLGATRKQLRAVKADLDEQEDIYLYFYWDGELSDSDEETISHVITQTQNTVTAKFPGNYNFKTSIERLDYPQPIPDLGYFVYLRDETIFHSMKWDEPVILSRFYKSIGLERIDEFRLLMCYAILGKIRPNLRYIWIELNDLKRTAYYSFYFDGSITDYDKSIAFGIIETVQWLFCPGIFTAKASIEQIDYPERLPWLGYPIYLRDESVFENEKPQEQINYWTNLKTGRQIVAPGQHCRAQLMACIRAVLIGEIRKACRAIQISINELKKKVVLWIHFDGQIYDSTLMVVDLLKREIQKLHYTCQIYAERMDLPAPIPHLGEFLFLRQDTEVPPPKTDQEVYEPVKKYCFAKVASYNLSHYLRAIFVDSYVHKKEILILFVCKELPSPEIKRKLQEFADELCKTLFPSYSSNPYYSVQEKIAGLGTIAYLANGETSDNELNVKSAFFASITKSLVGRVTPDLTAVKAELDTHKKRAFYWFYMDCKESESDSTMINQVVELSTPNGYTPEIETEFLSPIASIGTYIYKRYER
ncbi:MAG: hypothetical protein LLF94_07105 [Chlamydiales bacterium]|nr:hypothetical protein [Chlamydiales bacterium]